MKMSEAEVKEKFHTFLLSAAEAGYSDLHITEGKSCFCRLDGLLQKNNNFFLDSADMQQLIHILLPEKKYMTRQNDIDIAYNFKNQRLRLSIYRESGRNAVAIRFINQTIPTLDDIYPAVIKKLVLRQNGLILVTGPSGSGKSTTLASMLSYRAETSPCHIITLEDPIEYIFSSSKSIIHQREFGCDFFSFEEALKSAMRQDPDVILLGEIRDRQTMRAALSAAQTGHLVLSTLHTVSAAQSLIRIESMFAEDAFLIRTELSMVLQAVISQQLLKKKIGGRICAMEILTATDAVRALIASGRPQQILSEIQTGKNEGMQTMDMAIEKLRRKNII